MHNYILYVFVHWTKLSRFCMSYVPLMISQIYCCCPREGVIGIVYWEESVRRRTSIRFSLYFDGTMPSPSCYLMIDGDGYDFLYDLIVIVYMLVLLESCYSLMNVEQLFFPCACFSESIDSTV